MLRRLSADRAGATFPVFGSLLVAWVALLASACASSSQAQPVSPEVLDAQRLGTAFSSVAERVSNSVVSIRVEQRRKVARSPFSFFFGPRDDADEEEYGIARGNGSGVIIRKDGYILTNEHVVKGADRIEVLMRDGKKAQGKVIGTDSATDLAVVKIEKNGLKPLSFADSKKVRVGEWVLAVGSPFGLDYTVTAGVVSAVGRGGIGASEIEDYLQTDASINPGNSGGPLVNLRGEVLGINTMIVGRGSGIGFAVPASLAEQVTKQLIASGTVRRAWIGVSFQELTSELAQQFGLKRDKGALVAEVVPGGPAAKAGLRSGDVIVSVDGTEIEDGRDLLREVITKPVGSSLSLVVLRDGGPKSFRLKTAERPASAAAGQSPSKERDKPASGALEAYGLSVEQVTSALRQRFKLRSGNGLVVTEVKAGSTGDRAGIMVGDLIVEADKRPVTSEDALLAALRDGKALLRVQRDAGAFYVVLSK